MNENLSEFIKDLSNIFDSASDDSYISIYLNKYDYEKFIEKRIRECKSALKGDLLKNFNTTIIEVKGIIKKISKK